MLDSNQPSREAPDLQSGPLPATEYRPIFAAKGSLVCLPPMLLHRISGAIFLILLQYFNATPR